jgi:Raf kinase inhibitor-like YbhB/YbcL family protein
MKNYMLILFLVLSVLNLKINAAEPFTLESPSFKLNALIPNIYTCNGPDQSPPLAWRNAPAKTQSFALIMNDPDTPNGAWTHWILFNIPVKITELGAGSPAPEGAINGKNSWGGLGYRGPCPPIGAHRYVFKLYAMDNVLTLGEGATADTIMHAMTGHVLAEAELVGLYQKLK